MSKIVLADRRAEKELNKFPRIVQLKIQALLELLAELGKLEEPYAKKLTKNLFEIRVKYQGQWRAIYAYLTGNRIIILSAFRKKTQKTPQSEVEKAKNRLMDY